MKNLMKIFYFLPIIVFVGFGLLVGGSVSDNASVQKAGSLVLTLFFPIIAVVAVGIGIFTAMKKGNTSSNDSTNEQADEENIDNIVAKNVASKHVSTSNNLTEKDEELAKIADINNTKGYENQIKQEEFFAEHAAKSFKNASKKEKILSAILLIALLSLFALMFIFGYIGNTTGLITCLVLFAGTIIVLMIGKKITERLSMRNIDVSSGKYEVVCGEVKSCYLSSMSSSGVGRRGSTMRITGVVYKVTVRASGVDYVAYSKEYLNSGEVVMIAIIGKKRAAIVDADELVEKYDETGKFDESDDI